MLFETSTGRIVNVVVRTDPNSLATIGATELSTMLGFGVGLSPAPPGTDSVVDVTAPAQAFTTNDTESICAVYGSPSYCGD